MTLILTCTCSCVADSSSADCRTAAVHRVASKSLGKCELLICLLVQTVIVLTYVRVLCYAI
jgi:hypothetical protein